MVSMTPSETKTIPQVRTELVDFLDDQQKRSYNLNGFFDVLGSSGRRYRLIGRSFAQGIQLLDAYGYPVRNYCCHIHASHWQHMNAYHLNHSLVEENLLALFLMITVDELQFLKIAH